MRICSLPLFALFTATIPSFLCAQSVVSTRTTPYDSSAFAALKWREIGTFRGGRSVAVTGSAARPYEYYFGTTGGGVYKSTDAGETWVSATDKYFGGTIGAIAVSESNPDIVYVGTGEHWTEIIRNRGLPHGIIGNIGLAVSPAKPDRVWALVEADSGSVFRSENGGATWTRTNDGGKTFKTMIVTASTDTHELWIAPNDPQRMVEADDGGATVSINDGLSWMPEAQPTGQFYHVETTNHFPYEVCGSQQDSGTLC